MAVSFVSAATAVTALNVGSTLTGSFDAGTGNFRALLVFVAHEQKSTGRTATGCTYNGVAMDFLGRIDAATTTAFAEDQDVFGLIDPAAGANDIVATFSETGQDGAIVACLVQGAAAVEFGTPVKNAAADVDHRSVSVSISDGAIIVGCITIEEWDSGPFTPDAGTVERVDDGTAVGGGSNIGMAFFLGTREEASSGTYALGATATGALIPGDMTIFAVEVREAAAGGAATIPIFRQHYENMARR